MLFSSWRPAAFTSEERRTRASLGSWWTTSSRRSGVRLDWWDQIASWHEANTFWQTFFRWRRHPTVCMLCARPVRTARRRERVSAAASKAVGGWSTLPAAVGSGSSASSQASSRKQQDSHNVSGHKVSRHRLTLIYWCYVIPLTWCQFIIAATFTLVTWGGHSEPLTSVSFYHLVR